jgi:hypothetical protein
VAGVLLTCPRYLLQLTRSARVAVALATGDSVVYRFSTSVQDVNLAQGATTGAHSFTWEARNQ